MSFANPLSRLSSIIRAPVMVHTASSTESDWFLPYDGPIEPPPPPTRHPFAAELPQPKPVPAAPSSAHIRSKSSGKSESRERTGRDRSRSHSRDAKRKSQRSYVALDTGGGVGAYPAPDREHRDRDKERSSVQSDFTFGAHSAHTFGATSAHTRGQGSLPHPGAIDLQYTFPPTDDSTASSTGGKTSDPPIVFANHPFRMHTGSPPPRSHTASASLSTPWVRTIASSPVPDPAPMRKRTLTYQPGLVSSFGSAAETRVGYRESGAFLDLDAREREKIRPTLLPPSLSLLGKASAPPDVGGVDEHGTVHKSVSSDSYLGLRGQYDMRSHPYATANGPVRETRFGSVSTTTTTTTGGTGKPPIPPRPIGLKLKSSLKPSMSTPELRVHIPSSAPAAIPRQVSNQELTIPEGVGARLPRSAGANSGSAAAGTSASGGTTGLEVRTICDALIFARPRFRAHEITPPPSPIVDDQGAANRASVVVGESGLKGLACFPRARSRASEKEKDKEKEKERPGEDKFKTVEQVLRDRDQLDKEREEWNALGQGSLLNNRTRSLSRSQSRIGGGARIGGARPRRETVGGNGESGWGTLKLKKSVEMLAASALSQGHGHAPSASVSSSHRRGGGTQGSVSTVSHARGASGSVVSRAHSRADSWGQRVVCGSRSASSLGDDGPGGHMGQSSEGLLRGARQPVVEDYPVIDIRPIPTGDTHRARAPPPPPPVSAGYGIAGPSGRPQVQQRLSPGPNYTTLMPVQPPPSPGDSTIGLALSSPGGAALVLPNHPFSNRAGAHPAIEPPVLPGPETIATRHRHPPRSSGSTERARLDEPNYELRPSRSAPPLPSTRDLPPLQMKFPLGPGKSLPSPDHQHPFVARPVVLSTASGEVQRMFESAMLRSVVTSGGREWDPRRGSGDSGLGSSVNDHGIETYRAGGRKVSASSALPGSSLRGSAFGPPDEFEEVDDAPAGQEQEQEQEQEQPAPGPSEIQPPAAVESEKAVSPMGSMQSPFSLMDSLSPSSRRGVLTRVSSGMIDPALAGTAISPMLSHESSSSSFSSPRPLASIDDIESLRGIFYRPSPVRHASRLSSSQGSPPNETILDEESNESGDEEYGREITERYHDQEDWTFGRPLDSQHEPQPLWERRRETNQQADKTPLRIDLAPGTPSPTSATAPLPPAPIVAAPIVPRSAPASTNSHSYQDVPESVHDSDSQSERSVVTTSSQRATNENLTFGFVRSAQVDLLDVNAASRPQSTALSLIDMYDYEASISSSSPNTPFNHQAFPSPLTPLTHANDFLSPASAALPRPGMDRFVSGFPTPPADGTPMSSAVLSTYFNVDNQTSSRRSADERSCST